MKTTKDMIDEIKSELDFAIKEREDFCSQNTIDGAINLSYESLLRMRELDTKVKTLQSKLSELLINYNTELRNIAGYNVFCTTIDSNNDVKLVSKIVPYNHKDLFMEEFDIMNSTELPKLEDVENWLENNI